MSVSITQELEIFGPDRCRSLSVEQASQWCRRLARGHYENFSVLSRLVPADRRDDFAAVYAFCRWADDLGDEIGDAERSLELLGWWRHELEQCFAGEPRHPVFVALHPVVQRHDLPIKPFDDLIRAFEQDQTVTRYETWDEVIGYCRLSADPVGRLVLMVCGQPRTDELFECSDAACTALQLTNHWQDVKRDILERDRIYIPRAAIDEVGIDDFEDRLRRSAKQGYAVDTSFLEETRQVVRACVDKTWPLFQRGEKLLAMLDRRTRPLVWLFNQGGMSVLSKIELWNFETALHRPKLTAVRKLSLITRAWLQTKLGRGREKAKT